MRASDAIGTVPCNSTIDSTIACKQTDSTFAVRIRRPPGLRKLLTFSQLSGRSPLLVSAFHQLATDIATRGRPHALDDSTDIAEADLRDWTQYLPVAVLSDTATLTILNAAIFPRDVLQPGSYPDGPLHDLATVLRSPTPTV